MTQEFITLSYKQIGAIALILMNLIIIGPGGWAMNMIWMEANAFKEETKDKLDDLKDEVSQIKMSYVTRIAFKDYREQMVENLRYMDSKLSYQDDTR